MKVPLNPVREFAEMIRASGYRPSVRTLGVTVVQDGDVAAQLGRPEDTDLVVVEKVFLAV